MKLREEQHEIQLLLLYLSKVYFLYENFNNVLKSGLMDKDR